MNEFYDDKKPNTLSVLMQLHIYRTKDYLSTYLSVLMCAMELKYYRESCDHFLPSQYMQVSLGCNQPETLFNENNEPLDMTRHDCSIGNPFSGPGSITLRVQFTPRSGIVGNENDLAITFTVSSLNPESPATIADGSNSAISTSSIGARADISIDDG